MRINIVCGPFTPAGIGPSGAVEKIWTGLAKEFVRKGHAVTVYSRSWVGGKDHEIIDGVSIVRHSGFSRGGNIFTTLIKDFAYSIRIKRFLKRADITVTNSFFLPILLQHWNQQTGKIVVNFQRFPKHQSWLYGRVDRISTVSDAVSNAINAQSPSVAGLIKKIPNPIDPNIFSAITNETRANDSISRFMYSGRVHPEKGCHLLVSALSKVAETAPPVELVFVGPTEINCGGGGNSYREELEEKATGIKLVFEGNIEDPTLLAAKMREADYYCYPSLAETGEAFGVAPLEAMALGHIPVLSELECFREFAKPGINCLTFDHRSKNSVEELASSLLTLLNMDSDCKQRMSEAAARMSTNFGYEEVAEAYLMDWNSLIR